MQRTVKSTLIAFGLGALLLSGCGGGGGGGSTSSAPSVTYTGITTAAVITPENAETLTTAALESSENKALESTIIASSVEGDGNHQGLSLPQVATLLAGMKDLIKKPAPAMAAGATTSDPIYGTCGGTATITSTDNGSTDTYFNVSGTIAYNDFCNSIDDGGGSIIDAVINGTVNFSMETSTTADGLISGTFAMNTSYLTISAGGETIKYSLNFTAAFDDTDNMTVAMSSDYQDTDGKVYRVENYQVTLTAGYPIDTVTISGKLYHPDHGYVTVSTLPNLGFENCYDPVYEYLPTSGVLRVTGADGVYAEFRPISCVDGYQVCHAGGCDTYPWQ